MQPKKEEPGSDQQCSLSVGSKIFSAKSNASDSSPRNKGSKKKVFYYTSMMINPELIDNPLGSNENFSRDLFQMKRLKAIFRKKKFIMIQICDKRAANVQKKEVMDSHKFNDPQFQNEFEKASLFLKNNMEAYKSRVLRLEKAHKKTLNQFIKNNITKPFMMWFIPMRDQGPKITKIIFSEQLLNISGYKLDQAPSELERYQQLAFDFLDGLAYKAMFMSYVTSLRKYMEGELTGQIDKEAVLRESEQIVINNIRVKKNVKMQMRISTPEPFILMFEGLRILETEGLVDRQAQLRKERLQKSEVNAFKTLHKITKLPELINPNNSSKICTYVQIHPQDVKQEQKADEKPEIQPPFVGKEQYVSVSNHEVLPQQQKDCLSENS